MTPEEIKKAAIRSFLKTKKINPIQEKLMREAGFKIDIIHQNGLVHWKQGDITITLSHNKPISVKTLVHLVALRAANWTRQSAYINHAEFKVKA